MAIGLLYGLTGADVLLTDANDDNIPEFATATFTAWTTRTGGTQISELYTYPGQSATTTVTGFSDGAGRPDRIAFYGPDTQTGGIWLRNEAATSDTRWLIYPTDIADRAGTTDHGALSGLNPDDDHPQYFNTTRGDARYARTGTTQVIPATTFTTAGDLIVGTGGGTYVRLPRGTALQLMRVNAAGTGLEYFTQDLTSFAVIGGSFEQFADIADMTPATGNVLGFDGGVWTNVDLSSDFAPVGPDGRITDLAAPKYYVPIVVINEGGTVPADFPTGGIVFVRPAPVLAVDDLGKAAISSATGTNFTTLTSLAIGDYMAIGITISAESPATLPTVSAVVAGGGVILSQAVTQLQGSTAATYIFYGRATATVATGTSVTVTCSATRSDIAIHGCRITGLVTTSALDQTGIGGSGASTALAAGPTGVPTQANEVALGVFGYNATAGGPYTAGAGWTQVGTPATSTDAAPRSVILQYRILNTAAAITSTGTMTLGGTPWSGVVASFKAS